MKVTILMSTYNGESYLHEQMDSLLKQKNVELSIVVRDDGSTDGTQLLLQELKEEGRINWYTGPNLKPARSFLDLLRNAPDSDFYAFCDQDDIWLEDKLEIAINMLRNNSAELYYSSFTTVDKDGKIIEENVKNHLHKDSLGTSFVDLSVTGCTMVFTRRLRENLILYSPQKIMMHDSWVYKVALCLGYKVVYDPIAHIYYRQHSQNVIGAKKDWKKKWESRYRRWFKSVTNRRYSEVCELYNGYKSLMPPESLSVIEPIIEYKSKNVLSRFLTAKRKVYRTGVLKIDIPFLMSFTAKKY